MAEHISPAKKKFYKGPSFITSLVLHLAAVVVVLGLLSPWLFVREKPKNIVAVDLVNEKDLTQKLPDPASLGNQQIAKPKPIGGRATNQGQIAQQQTATTNPSNSRRADNSLAAARQSTAANPAKSGDSNQNVPKILKTIDPIRATPNDKGKTTENKSPYATNRQSVITNDKVKTGDKDALSNDEFTTLRQQIVACWQIPAGLRDIDKTTITVLLSLSPEGRVTSATLKNQKLLNQDTTRVLAESALRSFATPACQKLKLPKDKYRYWKNIEFTFDPYYAL
ncbi:MAG: hypothetical protein QM529_06665 [Hydrotalea sp.]|nr:hypothetical protein [Hydrotalea sp.]